MARTDDRGISRRGMIRTMGVCAAAALGAGAAEDGGQHSPPRTAGQNSVLGLKHPPLDKVRIGLIGAGSRGMSLLRNLLDIDGVAVTAVCDIVPQRVAAAGATTWISFT